MFLSPHLLRLATDARLVALVRERHPAAFEAVYNRHHRAILSFCRHMLGDPQEAEDAVQQTFLAAYSDLISSEKPIHLRAWLFTIARNRCYSLLRRRRDQPTDDLEEPVTEGLASQVQRRQDLRDLIVDLRRLPDDQRAALVLAELDALSHEEIASALGVPRDKVKALVFQARESLVASRTARETDCAEIRELLATQRGGALRRANLRRHLRECQGCREFRREIERQRRQLAVLLPVAPTVALKEGVLGATIGGGAAAGAGTGGLVLSTALKSGLAKGALGALLAGAGAATTIVATHGLQPTSHGNGHRHGTASPARGHSARAVHTTASGPSGPGRATASAQRTGTAGATGRGATGASRTAAAGAHQTGSFVRQKAADPFARGLGVPKKLTGGVTPRTPARIGTPAAGSSAPSTTAPASSGAGPVIMPQAPMTIPASVPTSAGGHGKSSAGTSPGSGHGAAGASGSSGSSAAPGRTGSVMTPQRGGGDSGSGVPTHTHGATGPSGANRGQGATGSSGGDGSGSEIGGPHSTGSGATAGNTGAGTTGDAGPVGQSRSAASTGSSTASGSGGDFRWLGGRLGHGIGRLAGGGLGSGGTPRHGRP